MKKIFGLALLALTGCYTPQEIQYNPYEDIKDKPKISSFNIFKQDYENAKESFEKIFEDFVNAHNKATKWRELSYLQMKIENDAATYFDIMKRNELREKLYEEGEPVYKRPSDMLFFNWWEEKSRESQIKSDNLLKNLKNSYERLDRELDKMLESNP